MNSRSEAIEDRDAHTLDWIFETELTCGSGQTQTQTSGVQETQPQEERLMLRSWLLGGEHTFWICGDPGSGKSVLMKTLAHHEKTLEIVQQWSSDRPLLVAQYYFWISGGHPLQKSITGLLRTFVYQAIDKFPGLLNEVTMLGLASDMASLPKASLLGTVLKIAQHISICLFIDGLDECDGDQKRHLELVEDLEMLSTSANIKMCLSSRPWRVFESAFASKPCRILLQQMTETDIFNFVCNTLARLDSNVYSRHLFEDLLALCPRQSQHYNSWLEGQAAKYSPMEIEARKLVYKVVHGADGIFLWASLVLMTLCSRIEAGETPMELKRHLDNLPTELEEYYYEQGILARIAETYRSHGRFSETAVVLKFASVPMGLPSITPFWWLRQAIARNEHSLETLIFGQAAAFQAPTHECWQAMAIDTKRYIEECCRGMLGVTVFSPPQSDSRFSYANVDFKHRTMHDFLTPVRGQKLLSSHLPQHLNDPSFLDELFLLDVKFLRQTMRPAEQCIWVCHDILEGCERNGLQPTRLRLWEAVAIEYFQHHCQHSGLTCLESKDADGRVDKFAMRSLEAGLCNITHLLLSRLPEVSVFGSLHHQSNLFDALDTSDRRKELNGPGAQLDLSLLRVLLSNGANPNHAAYVPWTLRALSHIQGRQWVWERAITSGEASYAMVTSPQSYSNRSVWHTYLRRVYQKSASLGPWSDEGVIADDKAWYEHTLEVIQALVEFGADLQSPICIADGSCLDPCLVPNGIKQHTHRWQTISSILESIFPRSRYSELMPLLDKCAQEAGAIAQSRLHQIAGYLMNLDSYHWWT